MTHKRISDAMDGLDTAYLTEALSHPTVAAKRIRAKRLLLRLGSLAACLCLIFSGVLISCSKVTRLLLMKESARAVHFLSIVDYTTSRADSYAADLQLSMAAGYGTDRYTTTVTSQTLHYNLQDNEQFVAATEVEICSTINNDDPVIQTMSYGYQGGKMFQSSYTQNTRPTSVYDKLIVNFPEGPKLWSKLSKDEYLTHVRTYRDTFGIHFNPENCKVKTCIQEKDKSWTATYADFSTAEMERFKNIAVAMEELLYSTYILSDVSIRIKTNEEFYLQSIEMSFAFQKKADVPNVVLESPKLTVTTTYRDFNAIVDHPSQELSDYQEVDDLRIADILANGIIARRGADQGFFRSTEEEWHRRYIGQDNENTAYVKSESTFAYTYQNQIQNHRSITTYLQYPDIYHTNVEHNKSGLTVEYNKKTGEWINEWPSLFENPSQRWLDYRKRLMSVGSFDIFNIADIQLINEHNGTYKIKLNDPGYNSYAEKIYRGWIVKQAEATILVVIQNGEVVEWIYEHDITTDHPERGGEHRIYRTSCVFAEDISEFEFDFALPNDWKWN